MINLKKQLNDFKEFKAHYVFKFKELITKRDGSVFLNDVCLREKNDGEWLGETEDFVNVGYKISGALPKILSNLFPYQFKFRGFKICSVESVFQALKFKDKKSQKEIFKLGGLDANRIKAATDYDWKISQTLYFQGKPMQRESKEYEDFVDELYVSLLANSLFVGALKAVKGRYILHAMGEMEKQNTTFSRYEFEFMLNALKDYVLSKKD